MDEVMRNKYSEINTLFMQEKIGAKEAIKHMKEAGFQDAKTIVFHWAGGDDIIKIDENGAESYYWSGKTIEEVNQRLDT